jgi:hypothetical protein
MGISACHFGSGFAEEYEALEVLELLWPWLTDKRRAQALALAPIEAILLGPTE